VPYWPASRSLGLAQQAVLGVLTSQPNWGRPFPLALGLALLSTVPVAWRAHFPLLATAIVLAANGACIYAAAPQQAAFQPFVALVLVAYSVGSRAEGRRALWVPPVLAAAAIPVFVAAIIHGQDPGNAIPSFVWLMAAWVVGRLVRGWRRKNVALELANRELDEQRELQARTAVMVERGRIARELHDVVAHNVSMMVVQARGDPGAGRGTPSGAECARCDRVNRAGDCRRNARPARHAPV
jgi:signal transduction histidine kinase